MAPSPQVRKLGASLLLVVAAVVVVAPSTRLWETPIAPVASASDATFDDHTSALTASEGATTGTQPLQRADPLPVWLLLLGGLLLGRPARRTPRRTPVGVTLSRRPRPGGTTGWRAPPLLVRP